jgi:hypothetical protein
MERLRWHRKGDDLRDLILMRLIAKDEIKKNSATGIPSRREDQTYRFEQEAKTEFGPKCRRKRIGAGPFASEAAQGLVISK